MALSVNFPPFVHLCHNVNATQTEGFTESGDCALMKKKRKCLIQNSSVLPGKYVSTWRTKTAHRSRLSRCALWAQPTGAILMFIFYVTQKSYNSYFLKRKRGQACSPQCKGRAECSKGPEDMPHGTSNHTQDLENGGRRGADGRSQPGNIFPACRGE